MDSEPENPISDLLPAAIAGDEKAFAEFVLSTVPTLLRIARAYCRRSNLPSDLGDDAVQEGLRKTVVWLRKPSSQKRHPSEISLSWLVTVVLNQLRTYGRQHRLEKEARRSSQPLERSPVPPQISEQTEFVINALSRLPDQDRKLIELVDIEDHPIEIAAQRLGVSYAAAQKRRIRALQRLRKEIERLRQATK